MYRCARELADFHRELQRDRQLRVVALSYASRVLAGVEAP